MYFPIDPFVLMEEVRIVNYEKYRLELYIADSRDLAQHLSEVHNYCNL